MLCWGCCSPVAELVAGGGKQLPKLPLVRQHGTRLQVEAPAMVSQLAP
jgi:hypothetical protein